MLKRILAAIPALALLVSVIWLHGYYAKIVVALVGVLCVHEMMNAATAVSKPMRVIGYSFAALLYPAYQFVGGFAGVSALIITCVMLIFLVLVFSGRDAMDGIMTLLPMIYPGLFFASLIALLCTPAEQVSRFLLIIAFGAAVLTDTFAYFTGLLFGKHKLASSISPKKTIEGAVGGTVFGTGAVFLAGVLMQSAFGVDIEPLRYLPLGFALSVLSQIGDLAASVVKRRFGVKDYGHIMGAHGGAMDRLDSVLFICPAVYAYYILAA